jgi:hypothetical protein
MFPRFQRNDVKIHLRITISYKYHVAMGYTTLLVVVWF